MVTDATVIEPDVNDTLSRLYKGQPGQSGRNGTPMRPLDRRPKAFLFSVIVSRLYIQPVLPYRLGNETQGRDQVSNRRKHQSRYRRSRSPTAKAENRQRLAVGIEVIDS